MTRGLSTINAAAIDANHVHEVLLVKLEWDSPAWVHSGFGSIDFDGDTYIGVGGFGGISDARESEQLGPLGISLELSDVDASFISIALSTVTYKDAVTIYEGYRQDDGTLLDDPWIAWKGWFDFAQVSQADSGKISVTCQHDLAILDEKDGSRFSDEDQKRAYASDVFFAFIHQMATVKLVWGGGLGPVGGGRPRIPTHDFER